MKAGHQINLPRSCSLCPVVSYLNNITAYNICDTSGFIAHTHTCWVSMFWGLLTGIMVFILYKFFPLILNLPITENFLHFQIFNKNA